MRDCILSPSKKQYNPETEFVSYTIQKRDGSRFLILQYQRGRSDEHFVVITPQLTAPGIGLMSPSEFKPVIRTANEEDVQRLLNEEEKTTRYHMNIVPKNAITSAQSEQKSDLVNTIINSFQTMEVIRASNLVQAWNAMCGPISKLLLNVEINPVDLALFITQEHVMKKAEGHPKCIIS